MQWIQGEPKRLENLRGEVVLLDFWSISCAPCVASLPRLNELANKWRDKGLRVFGDHDPTPDASSVRSVLEAKSVDLPVVIVSSKALEAYGVDAWPTYVLIDRKGIVRAYDHSLEQLDDKILKLLVKQE